MNKADVESRRWPSLIPPIAFGAAALAGLCVVSRDNYLLFHTLSELLSTAVAWSVFLLVWNARRFIRNEALILLGVAYLSVGFIDVFHTVSYDELGFFPRGEGVNYATQLWVSARLLEAFSLLAFAGLLGHRVRPWPVLFAYGSITAFLLVTIFGWHVFPACYVEGEGSTFFKRGAECGCGLALLAGIFVLARKREHLDPAVCGFMIAAMAASVAGEVAFTLYADIYDLPNLAGHLLKIVSYFLVYMALIRSSLMRPYALLFRELAQERQTLQENKDRLQTVLNLSADQVMVLDREHRLQSLHRPDGAGESGDVGKHAYEFLEDQDQERVRDLLDEVVREGKCRQYDTVHRMADGSKIYLNSIAVPLITSGEIRGSVVSSRNVTDVKHAEEALQEERDRAHQYLDIAAVMFVMLDREGVVTLINQRGSEILGYEQEEVLGKNWFAHFLPRKVRERVKHVFDQMMLDEVELVEYVENEVLRKDGEERIIAWHNTVLKDERGSITGVLSSGEDITVRKRAEAERERVRSFMQTVIDGFPEGLMVINRDYTIELANRAVRDMAGGVDPVVGCLKCHMVSHGSTVPCEGEDDPCPLMAVLEKRAPVTVEHIHYDAEGGAYPLEITAAPIFDDDGEVVQFIETCRDIRDRKRAEAERLELERQVQHAQKLESLGILAGGIAHDFNNILAAVLGYAELAMADLGETHPARLSLREIVAGANRAAGLTRQMLAYSGKGNFVIENMDMTVVVDDMAHLLRTSISRTIALNLNLERSLPLIKGDVAQMQQIVMNLITNAADAIGEEHGVITLATGWVMCDGDCLSRNLAVPASPEEAPQPGSYVFVEVRDTGCGMDEETKARLFEPFYTTKFTGRGLGMAAVLGIVRGHKGVIMVDSGLGKGSVFRVLFPALEQSGRAVAPQVAAPASEVVSAPYRSTVLIVDDEEVVRNLTSAQLSRMGLTVLEAANGREGVKVFRMHADEIGCVFLDLMMPHMRGQDCYRALRDIRDDVKVVVMSGYAEETAVGYFPEERPPAFLQKPFDMATLKEVVGWVLGEQRT